MTGQYLATTLRKEAAGFLLGLLKSTLVGAGMYGAMGAFGAEGGAKEKGLAGVESFTKGIMSPRRLLNSHSSMFVTRPASGLAGALTKSYGKNVSKLVGTAAGLGAGFASVEPTDKLFGVKWT